MKTDDPIHPSTDHMQIVPCAAEREAKFTVILLAVLIAVPSGAVCVLNAVVLLRALLNNLEPLRAIQFCSGCAVLIVAAVLAIRNANKTRTKTRRSTPAPLVYITRIVLLATLSLIFLFLFEATFFSLRVLWPGSSKPFLGAISAGNHVPSKYLGYTGMPGIYGHTLLPWNGHSGFDVLYTQNAFGRRVVPQEGGSEKSSHLLFLGCSLTYGVGCNDSETLPALVANAAPEYSVYNFAQGGYCPSQCLSLFMHDNIRAEVAEAKGIAIYVFIGDHVLRAISSMRRRNTYANIFPMFKFGVDKSPVFVDRFDRAQPWRTFLYRIMGKEQYVAWSGIDWPLCPSQSDIEYTANLLSAARDLYCAEFDSREFYVLVHPLTDQQQVTAAVCKALREKGVPVLDHSGLFDITRKELTFSDMHPTPLCNQLLANKIANDLNR